MIDTLQFARDLEATGRFTRPDAEALADTLNKHLREGVASKADVDHLGKVLEEKLTAAQWRIIGAVAVLLLGNVAATWGIVASYAVKAVS